MPWARVNPVWKPEAVGLCGHPYHNHPHGCSNFCKREGCPPTMVPLEIALDECWFIWIKYKIGDHVRRMLDLHPGWSMYQAQNIYYWQGSARKTLKVELSKFLKLHPTLVALGPKIHLDSWGIDMSATMQKVGVNLEWGEDWGTRDHTYVMRYAGYPLEKVNPERMAKLRRMYPAIYHERIGKCVECQFRPCLKYTTGNPELYVGHTINGFRLLDYTVDRGWRARCASCGVIKIARHSTPLCISLVCQRCATKKPAEKRARG